MQPNRPPSPSKRSPTRTGTLSLIPEEEESQQQQRDQRQGLAVADGSTSQGSSGISIKAEQTRSGLDSQAPSVQQPEQKVTQQTASRQPFKMSIPPYASNGNDNATKAPISASPTLNSAPLKVSIPGQHAQAMEVRRQIFALQIPTLLLVNAELVKGCIFLLEKHNKNNPNVNFLVEGSYQEYVEKACASFASMQSNESMSFPDSSIAYPATWAILPISQIQEACPTT